MAKLTLTDLANLQNETTATTAINANNALIEAALENTLSRDGTSPNDMDADLDMNGHHILNLPTPTLDQHPVRLSDLGDYLEDAEQAADDAAASAATALGAIATVNGLVTQAQAARDAAQTAETNAETAETNAETAEVNAEAAEDLAERWANEDEDVEVEGGLFSAKHWAAKASEAAVGDILAADVEFSPTGDLVATDVQAALSELDTEKLSQSDTDALYQPLDASLTDLAALADPGADRLIFWDESANSYEYLTAGAGLTITGTTIEAAGGSGATTALDNLASVAINTSLLPGANDGAALGDATHQFSDLFLAEGGVINFDNGDLTVTQAGNNLTIAGGDLTVTNLNTPSIELGTAATDTTLSRVSAGVAAIEGNNILTANLIGSTVQGYDADTVKKDVDMTGFTAGYTATADNDGTKSSGTYTPDPAGGNLKYITNGGAFTLAAPSASGDYTIIIQMTNNGSAGTVTLSGFAPNTLGGDALTTTNGHDFFLYITKINGFVTITCRALQ